ncbi:AAA family ATPase [Caulobacter soli]|uniref:AAA family ATPase n=1 Tax=Caulobacter soli TaxID=2708539 RepID=UPI0013EBF459|nr:AAA family ATPase [Caulobacter soli]
MNIERLQIEGGFLDGFDVKFASGLNVLIGARGTGKTSVIELLRFALAARNHTTEAGQRSAEHARAVLGDGEVTVQVGDILDTIIVSRAGGDAEPQANGKYEKPLIFSQTEIENIGLSEGGRLRLVDSFVSKGASLSADEAAAVSAIKSIFKEISALEDERNSLGAGLEGLDALQQRIQAFEAEEEKHRAASSDLTDKQAQLATITAQVTNLAVREEVLSRFAASAQAWAENLQGMIGDDFGVEAWDELDGPDPLAAFRKRYDEQVGLVGVIASKFDAMQTEAVASKEALSGSRMAAEAQSRALRVEVEQSVSGAGAVSRQLAQLRTEVAQINARRKIVDERDQRLRQMRVRRDERIRALDAVRLERFEQRTQVTNDLNKALGPQIKVSVDRYGQYADYNRALTDALRGSGMRYNDLVGALTQSISPHELVQFLDTNDFVGLADISGIPKDRAARLLGHLREAGAADIVTVSIEDNVRMSLLDGVDYKDVEHLSAGQRCTVILSIVLQHSSRTLIIDQPEDHLDNAYIASTIIKAIKTRKANGQLIISTHNANIPVLGEADLVVEMTSDGRNGFVQVCEALSNSKAVDAITNVMEGGRDAFSSRARFYDEHEL